MFETEEKKERLILVAVASENSNETKGLLKELAALTIAAGADVAGELLQVREKVHPATYLGTGKIQELEQMLYMQDADGIICDDELTTTQLSNLQTLLKCKVYDRTIVILDIFAKRALTSEGKIQVEIAQLGYRQSKMAGLGISLSRQGGGIGTRGPGEKKLETDKRLIADRIAVLKKELRKLESHRDELRKKRRKKGVFTAAIVGYTNAGKSTLLNTLTGSDVLAKDMLFATLDPTTRMVKMPHGGHLLLTDTVGFIRKLPHNLINAFRSTLEEAVIADVIIHVVDASCDEIDSQMETVYETLDMLGASGKKILTLFNKMDIRDNDTKLVDERASKVLYISAKGQRGIDKVKDALEELLCENSIYFEGILPYDQAGKIALIREQGQLLEESYKDEGIDIRAYIPKNIYAELKEKALE